MAIAFVEKTDFHMNRPAFEIQMQQIINICTKLYKAIGGRIQEKRFCFIVSARSIRIEKKLLNNNTQS